MRVPLRSAGWLWGCVLAIVLAMLSSTTAAAGAEEGPRYDTRLHTYDAAVDLAPLPSAPLTVGETGASQSESVIFPGPVDLRHIYDPVRSFVAPTSALGKLCSFSGETEVLMADGTTKPISEIDVGDWVLAEDPETGERGAREVTHLWVHQDTIIDLGIAGHDVATTEDHPFWNHTDSEWQRADALDSGDSVLTADVGVLTVEGLDWSTARTTSAYNLTVDDIHTYFVGVGGDEVLVHNSNLCDLGGYYEHLTYRDLDAARRELLGEVVAVKPNGVPFDHVNEVMEAQQGLVTRIDAINRRLAYPHLPASDRPALETALSKASQLLDYSEGFVPR